MVRIITVKHIKEFGDKHPQYAKALNAWIKIVQDENTIWLKPQDIVETFGEKAVDLIKTERAVIDIKGNHIRVIVKYQFFVKLKKCSIYIKWIGSHADYDKLCKNNQQHEIDMF